MTRTLDAEILVVGAGPAGIAAATVAAEAGRRVVLLESSPWRGGAIWRGCTRVPLPDAARAWLRRLDASGAEVRQRTTVVAAPDSKVLVADTPDDPLIVRWNKLILATGARERFLPFPGWTLPNVLGPGALQLLIKSGLSLKGRRVVVAGSGPLLLAAAALARGVGAEVVLLAEQSDRARLLRFGVDLAFRAPGKLVQGIAYRLRLRNVPYRIGWWPIAAEGRRSVEQVALTNGRQTLRVACDYFACAFGFVANVELPQLLGCAVRNGRVPVRANLETSQPDIYCAGEPTGIGGVERALLEGQIAGTSAAGRPETAATLTHAHHRAQRFVAALDRAFALRPELQHLARPDTIVCRCEDVPRHILEPHASWRAAKLLTRCGMGPCQGRICGEATRVLFGWEPDSVRPPLYPTRVETLGAIVDPW